MKGVILAGGTGSRLHPLTRITNKHLLPVYDKPMIFYPIETLVSAGIDEIMVVTGGKNSGDFLRLLANGKEFGLEHIHYTYQEGEGGIAEALGLAEHFADKGDFGIPASKAHPGQQTVIEEPIEETARLPLANTEGRRDVGVGAADSGPGSGSGGDLDPDITGVGTGRGLAAKPVRMEQL